MKGYALTPAAAEDLAEIADFVRRDNPTAARRLLQRLRTAMRQLVAQPGLGHLREDLAPEALLFWPVGSYLIVYRPELRPIQIVRVLHGARDLGALLD